MATFSLVPTAVGGGDQDRVDEAGGLEVEQRAEARPAPASAPGRRGGLGQRLDRLDQRRAGVDVDAGVALGQAVRPLGHPAGSRASAERALARA